MHHPVPTPYFVQDGTSQFSHLFLHELSNDEVYFPQPGEQCSEPATEPEVPSAVGLSRDQVRATPPPPNSEPPPTEDITSAPAFIQRALTSPLRRGSITTPPGPNTPQLSPLDGADASASASAADRRFRRASAGAAAAREPAGASTPAGAAARPRRPSAASPARGLLGLAGLSPSSPQAAPPAPADEEWTRYACRRVRPRAPPIDR
jgi:hypothetical protein